MAKRINPALQYIYLAVGCGVLGVIITFIVIMGCQHLGIDIAKNLWVLAIPVLPEVAVGWGVGDSSASPTTRVGVGVIWATCAGVAVGEGSGVAVGARAGASKS